MKFIRDQARYDTVSSETQRDPGANTRPKTDVFASCTATSEQAEVARIVASIIPANIIRVGRSLIAGIHRDGKASQFQESLCNV